MRILRLDLAIRSWATLLLCGGFCGHAYGQSGEGQAVYLSYANDYFKATDYYFTQGIELHYRQELWEVYAAQDGYTPTSIADPNIRTGDRPYAGTLYGGLRRYGGRQDSLADWRWGGHIGVIGPQAKGEEQQSYLHRKFGDEIPMGWRHQIANDLLVGADARYRRWWLRQRYLAVATVAEAMLSSYKTRATAELLLRAGWPKLRLEVMPAVIVPVYDATLQGGLFNSDSPYTLPAAQLRRSVGRLEVGISGQWGRTVIRFSHVYLTPEFDGGRAHAWGMLSLGVKPRRQ